MIKGAPVISEATAIPEASVTTEVQKYPAEVLRCSCFCFCGDQVQKLLLRFCFVGTLKKMRRFDLIDVTEELVPLRHTL